MVVAFSEDAAVLPWRPGVVLILRVAYWRCNTHHPVTDRNGSSLDQKHTEIFAVVESSSGEGSATDDR